MTDNSTARSGKTSTLTHATPGQKTPTRSTALIATAGVVASAAFTAGGVLTQAVTVPMWRAMEPAAFLQQFASSGPATGAVLFPFELAAVALLAAATYTTVKQRHPARLAWALATGAMTATVLLLPAYFAGANAAFLDPAFAPDRVADELSTWNTWNWLRTGLAGAATAAGMTALTTMLRR